MAPPNIWRLRHKRLSVQYQCHLRRIIDLRRPCCERFGRERVLRCQSGDGHINLWHVTGHNGGRSGVIKDSTTGDTQAAFLNVASNVSCC